MSPVPSASISRVWFVSLVPFLSPTWAKVWFWQMVPTFLAAELSEPLHPDRVREAFLGFVHKHGKEYVNDETEMKYRMGVFAENLAAIEESNAMNTFYSEVNEFADETWEEFSARLLDPQADCSATTSEEHEVFLGRHHHRYPESRDWRDLGVVSPVKNQGRCGSCWTFSTTGALEAAYALEFGSILSLSEQQILDCAVAFDNWGCSGGWPQHAMAYVKFNGGIDLEASPRVALYQLSCETDTLFPRRFLTLTWATMAPPASTSQRRPPSSWKRS